MTLYNFVRMVQITLVITCFTNVISSNNCNFNVKMKQVLHNDGFHRNLTYGIVFNVENNQQYWLYRDCIVGVDQVLPPGIYANPDELSDFRRMGKINAVPKNKINVELSAEQSSLSSVYVIGKLNDYKVYLWLPVHARYHRATRGGGMAVNKIEPPKLYLRCPDRRLDVCQKAYRPTITFLCNGISDEKCKWKEISYTIMTDPVTWEVPVGNLNHYYIVATTTAVAVIVGCLYLLVVIYEYKISIYRKKKQN